MRANGVKALDARSGVLISAFESDREEVVEFVLAADGLLSAASDHTVRVWNASTGKLLRILEIPGVMLAADGSFSWPWSLSPAFSNYGTCTAERGSGVFAYGRPITILRRLAL